MSDLFKTINKICLPAQIYLGISTLSILGMLFQNIGQQNKYCIGKYNTQLPCNNMSVFIFKIFYVIIVTWILQKLCARGYKSISWLLVLLPYVSMFVLLLLMVLFFKLNPHKL